MTLAEAPLSSSRQTDIIQTTLDLAFEVGPNAVSTSLIAKRLRISQPAIYKHFTTKDAIWQAISEQLAKGIAGNLREGRASSLPPERVLRDVILRHLAFVQHVPALPDIMVMRHASGCHQAIRQRLQQEMAQLRNLLADLIRQAQNSGVLRADIAAQDITTLLMGVIQGLVLRMIVSRDPSKIGDEGERLLDLQLSILEPQGPLP